MRVLPYSLLKGSNMESVIRIREVMPRDPAGYICRECMFYNLGCVAPDEVPVCSQGKVYQFVSLSNVKVQHER